MQFGSPVYLHGLWLVPIIAVVLHFLFLRRERLTDSFVDRSLLTAQTKLNNRKFWQRKSVALMIIVTAASIALARPQWGYQVQDVKRQGVDILIAVDVSKSMLTQDVKPSRLERTKLEMKDLLKKLKGDRVGLIAFAGDAFLVCPLTNDYNGFMLSLNDLNVDTIPRGGTDISSAIKEAQKSYTKSLGHFKSLVIVTDGEDLEGDVLETAKKASKEGVKIYTVGIGTAEGDLIQVGDDRGNAQYLKDAQGNYVKSRLNENVLQQIAYLTGGAYVRSSGAQFGLEYLYTQQISKLDKQTIEERQEKKYYERFQWFLSVCLIALFF